MICKLTEQGDRQTTPRDMDEDQHCVAMVFYDKLRLDLDNGLLRHVNGSLSIFLLLPEEDLKVVGEMHAGFLRFEQVYSY